MGMRFRKRTIGVIMLLTFVVVCNRRRDLDAVNESIGVGRIVW